MYITQLASILPSSSQVRKSHGHMFGGLVRSHDRRLKHIFKKQQNPGCHVELFPIFCLFVSVGTVFVTFIPWILFGSLEECRRVRGTSKTPWDQDFQVEKKQSCRMLSALMVLNEVKCIEVPNCGGAFEVCVTGSFAGSFFPSDLHLAYHCACNLFDFGRSSTISTCETSVQMHRVCVVGQADAR